MRTRTMIRAFVATAIAMTSFFAGAADDEVMTGSVVYFTVTGSSANSERLVVDEVQTGSLETLAGRGKIDAIVMLAHGGQVTLRTLEQDVPVVVIDTHNPDGDTQFQTGEDVQIAVPAAIEMRLMAAVPTTDSTADTRTDIDSTVDVDTEADPANETEPAVIVETETVVVTTPEPSYDATATTMSSGDEGRYDTTYRTESLPQTASNQHLAGFFGLLALFGAFSLVGLRRMGLV